MLVSVIIPTLNEQKHIISTINSIREALAGLSHEIIIVDNGSNDNTVNIANTVADKVLVDATATIGALRNIGVTKSHGRILVFNDADVLLSKEWRHEFDKLASPIEDSDLIIGGSLDVPDSESLLLNSWFKPLLARKASGKAKYVGTGHMIVSKKLFLECNGFDEVLTSGEDFDFCQRAVKRGATIEFNRRLKAIHLGYPLKFSDFFRRELWHGSGDFKSLKLFMSSKVAVYSSIMLAFHVAIIFFILTFKYEIAVVTGMFTVCFPIMFSVYKFPSPLGFMRRIANLLYSYGYLLARSLSWARAM